MLSFTQGNLLSSNAEALVNTVNTVGIMGKGIALMFKEKFPENFLMYKAACKRGEVRVGQMLVTERRDMYGLPRWIINFPTKQHWRSPSQIEWIEDGLRDLVRVIRENGIKSIAIPPLGSGNGGLIWHDVRKKIETALSELADVQIIVYEPTDTYQNVAKRQGVEKLTPARALIAELVRRYWVLGFECSLLEIQKLAYFLERTIDEYQLENPLDLQFSANKFGPYSPRLSHLLNSLDGSYLHCDKRLADANVLDVIRFDEKKRDRVATYLRSSEAKAYMPALNATEEVIDGFQSPLGMELLATVDWLLLQKGVLPDINAIRAGLAKWPGGPGSAERKMKMFDDRLVGLALERLASGH
jgi:O-acetyl-ADP-ribose deacetylase (regulator of RNase III)